MATTTTPPRGGKHRPGGGTSPAAQTPQTKTKTKPKKKRGFFRRFWWVFFVVPLVGILALFGTLWFVYSHLTLPNPPAGPQTSVIYDRHGAVIARLHATVNRTEIPLDAMPASLKNAVIASEDKNFYHEGGISPIGIARAAFRDLISHHVVQGGSTITQQYVKLTYTGSERTIARKVKEALLAMKLDHALTKNQILEKYLNIVYFGNGAYGVQAAAQTYWHIPARKLTVPESATLSGLIPAPSTFEPVNHPEVARERRNTVLTLMAQQGYISAADAARYKAEPLKVSKSTSTAPAKDGYFVDYVTRQLLDKYRYDETFSGGLRVHTTLDATMQAAAEKAVADHLSNPKDPSAALVAIDPTTGAIRALVGGKNFNTAQFNLALQAHRQAGSAFKPFTFATAMEERINPHSLWHGPPEIVIPNPECYNNGQPWDVHSYADESAGTMDLVNALAGSVNTIFAQLVVQVGPAHVVDLANRMGIQSKLHPYCSITLGTQEVTPLDMADAYATFAARGMHHVPQGISEIKTASGATLQRPDFKGNQVMDQNDADLTTYAMEQVIAHGTGTSANIGRPAAGKTGTAQNWQDAWFCGFVPQLTTCVWVGYPKGEISMQNVEGYPNVLGGTIPAAIWHDFMSAAVSGMPVANFATPSFSGYDKTPGGVTPSPSPSSPSPSPSSP
ncbi:MAG TPA: hypothetical protein DIU14_07920, partial [Actinobacteria bacterium]|nr:hypothetical protein [Actinomycetota bacterium]